MLDTLGTSFEPVGMGVGARPALVASAPHGGELFMQLLDEVDYGMLLVDAQGRILHANHVARQELASGRTLREHGAKLIACVPSQSLALAHAIGLACQGQRVLLDMGLGEGRLAIAFSPLAHPVDDTQPSALVVCGKREVCQALSMHCFARLHGLTPAEEEVLKEVCTAGKPESVARALGVALATVRSHIQSIRRKTGAASMPEVIKRMAALPPLVPALRLH